MKIISIGQAAYDITLPVNSYPIENTKIRFDEKIECGGGSASNVSYLLAKWGLESSFAGSVARDYYGDLIKKELDDIKVNTKYLSEIPNSSTTSSYIIANTSNGSRTILSTKRHEDMLINKVFEDDIYDFIYLDGYETSFAKEVISKNKHAKVIIDAGSMKEGTVELASLSDYLVCSKDFAEEFTGLKINFNNLSTLLEIYDKLENHFNNKVVITLESKGSFTKHNNEYKLVPSIKVKEKDSTGAGDIYHGAFTYFISKGEDLIKAMEYANIAGAISTERVGGRFSIPSLEEVLKTHEKYFN